MKMIKKLNEFNRICQDWNYRDIDMTQPHIMGLDIDKNTILITCEMLSPKLDYYLFGEGGIINNKKLVKDFKKLNLEKKKDVINFFNKIESMLDWKMIENNFLKQEEKELNKIKTNEKQKEVKIIVDNKKITFSDKELAISYYETLSWLYEEAFDGKYKKIAKEIEKNGNYNDNSEIKEVKTFTYDDEMESVDVPCKILGKEFHWEKFYDGSGCLVSSDGNEYMFYDLQTNEYKVTKESSYEFFPLDYYYVDGISPKDFKPFEYMEKEMRDKILSRKKDDCKLDL